MSDDKRTAPLDPDAPPTAEELAEAEALRDALADPSRRHAGADFARAVSLAHAPRPIDREEHARIVEAALAGGDAKRSGAEAARGARTERRGVLVRVSFGAGAALALAAGFALLFGTMNKEAPEAAVVASSVAPTAFAQTRSTQALFHEPFARSGGESARIDRIASARASDLRDNRFAAWGVR
jgi:hypothetical protein